MTNFTAAYRGYLQLMTLEDTQERLDAFGAGWAAANSTSEKTEIRELQERVDHLVGRLRLVS